MYGACWAPLLPALCLTPERIIAAVASGKEPARMSWLGENWAEAKKVFWRAK
jgi:hypothetical protein